MGRLCPILLFKAVRNVVKKIEEAGSVSKESLWKIRVKPVYSCEARSVSESMTVDPELLTHRSYCVHSFRTFLIASIGAF